MIEKLDQIYEELGLSVTKKASKKNEKLAKRLAKNLAFSKRKIDKKAPKVEVEPKVDLEPGVEQETQALTLLNSKRQPSPNRKNPADKVA